MDLNDINVNKGIFGPSTFAYLLYCNFYIFVIIYTVFDENVCKNVKMKIYDIISIKGYTCSFYIIICKIICIYPSL